MFYENIFLRNFMQKKRHLQFFVRPQNQLHASLKVTFFQHVITLLQPQKG